jgi:hypothetical protein
MQVNFGIEYELEGLPSNIRPPLGWRMTKDNTLREGGKEFIFSEKATIATSKARVRRLLESISSQYTVSHRCSTHIHIDTTALKGYQRVALLYGLILHDAWFYQYGAGRNRNNFCSPVLFSPSNTLLAIDNCHRACDWKEGEPSAPMIGRVGMNTLGRALKYNSINLSCIDTLGTIELRHFNPLINLEEVYVVLNKINHLFNKASSVDPTCYATALTVWQDYDKTLTEEYQWLVRAVTTYNNMRGL